MRLGGQRTLVDAHVHLHACFDVASFFASAENNLGEAARQSGFADWMGCLLLADAAGQDSLTTLQRQAEIGRAHV